MWFAKNSDRHPDETQIVESYRRRPAGTALRTQYLSIPDAGAAAFVGSRPTWLWGCEHGVNEHGVAAGNEKIYTTTNPRRLPRALLGMDIVRLVLERARTADDALAIASALIEEYGQGGSGEPDIDDPYFSSFLFADAQDGWIVETDNRTWAARPVGTGAAISNRISLSTDWTRASADLAPGRDFDDHRHPKPPTARADFRLARTRACVELGAAAGVGSIARTLRDHGPTPADPFAPDNAWHGFTVCVHRPEFHAQTTASMIVDLRADGTRRVWACLGNPCVGVYVPAFPPHVAPELSDPAQWQRFAALRHRVEADPTELPAIRRALAPVETELWDAADAAHASGSLETMRAFAASAYLPVHDALRILGV